MEACDEFSNRQITNPELSAIIANPTQIQPSKFLDIDPDDFDELIVDPKIKNDQTQRDTVVQALYRQPVYLIQGPPGTGKTTTIVEIIHQLIRLNKNIKILVVSQSNKAVDNVLEKLLEEDIPLHSDWRVSML